MSLTFLLLLFLCFSFNDCNARCLTGLGKKKIDKKCHFVPKNDDDNKSVDLSSNQLASHRNGEEDKKIKTGMVVEAEMPKVMNIRRTIKRVLKVKKEKTSSGSLKTHESSSLVSVSNWRVPHKKKGYKNPGFNLDYSPPKTHPPSHN